MRYLANRKLKTRLELPRGATYSIKRERERILVTFGLRQSSGYEPARRNSSARVLPMSWLEMYNIIPMSHNGLRKSLLR